MITASTLRWMLRMSVVLALVAGVGGYFSTRMTGNATPAASAELVGQSPLRGVWVRGKAITTAKDIDAVIARARSGGFNAIFAGVFTHGQALYNSKLVEKYDKVEQSFDPLAYLVPAAHRQGIEVHAWFVNGEVGDQRGSPILAKRPEWALIGPDGATAPWLNFARADVRAFTRDLMLETVQRYKVDGLHFDYMRYPDPEWGFDAYSAAAFAEVADVDLDLLRYADLPAYGVFDGNPLAGADSAQVLAHFANGVPAVTLNKFGDGQVILLNWNASKRTVAAGSEILRRSLLHLLNDGGQVYLLRSKTNARRYGYESFERARDWVQHLGWDARGASEADIKKLPASSVLVLPNVYLIAPETADDLAEFTRRGGGLIFLDGPSKSIGLKVVRALTGMRSRSGYFSDQTMIVAHGAHPLIPTSDRPADLELYQRWDAAWKDFRKQGISKTIKAVYDRAKSVRQDVAVSVTITANQEKAAEEVLQDWTAWQKGGYIDFLVPRGYVDDQDDLRPMLRDWKLAIQRYGNITLGLIAYADDGKSSVSKPARQLLDEMGMALSAGSRGVVVYDLDRMSNEQLQALAAEGVALRTTSSATERVGDHARGAAGRRRVVAGVC